MKRLFIGIGILIFLLVGGLAVAIMTLNSVDWSEYEEPIANAVKDATGRELRFSGALNVNVGLSPGISADKVTLQNADWASRAEMLTLEHLEVRLKLLPLIFGRVEVSQLEVVGLDLLLETDQHGKGNWEFQPADAVDVEQAPATNDESSLTAVVKKAVIQNATVVYRDGVTGTSQRIDIVELIARMKSAHAPLIIDLMASYGEESIELTGELGGIGGLLVGESLHVDLMLNVAGARIDVTGQIADALAVSGINVSLSAKGKSLAALSSLAGTEIPDLGAYEIAANVIGTAEKFDLTNLSIDVADMQIDGDLKANIAAEPLRMEATLRSSRIDLTRWLSSDDAVEPESADAGSARDPSQRLFPDDPLPLDELNALESIDATVNLVIDELIVDSETTLSNFSAAIRVTPKAVSISSLKLDVMDATIDGRIGLKAQKSSANVQVALNVRHPSVGDLVEDDADTMLTGGPLDMDIDVVGRGRSIRDIMASLNGSLRLDLGTARIDDVWVQRAFSDVTSLLDQAGQADPIDLHCVTTNFVIKDGIALTDNLVVDTTGISLFGVGRIDLRDESLALEFDRLATSTTVASALPPFQLRGTLAAPKGKINTKALVRKSLGFGVALLTQSDVERAQVAAATGPERCRQRLVVYKQIQEDRGVPKEISVENASEAVEQAKNALDKLSGFFKKKKEDVAGQP